MSDRLPYRIKFRSVWPKLVGRHCMTVRRTIYCRFPWITEKTHAHEYAHIVQYHSYGVAGFLVRYFWHLLTSGYKRNPFEIEAHAYADAHYLEFEIVREPKSGA